MKARVKYNNEIIDVIQVGTKTHLFDLNNVEFLDNPQDYWTRLEHQYAGMAMQGICSSDIIMEKINRINAEGDKFGVLIAELSANLAHALVQKLKEKEESIIVWHTGKPISNGRHLVTYSYGGIGQSYAKDGKWTDEEGDFIIAWCHFGDIKEYGE